MMLTKEQLEALPGLIQMVSSSDYAVHVGAKSALHSISVEMAKTIISLSERIKP